MDDRSMLALVSRYASVIPYSLIPTGATEDKINNLPSPLDFDEAGTILTECTDGSYCCGLDATDCCDNGGGTKINRSNGQIILSGQITRSATRTASPSSSRTDPATTSSTSSAMTTSSSSSLPTSSLPTANSVTTSPSLPSPSSSDSDSTLSTGAKAGIAIGCIAGAALVAGLLYLLFRERRKRKALLQQGGPSAQTYPWQQQQQVMQQHNVAGGAPVYAPPQEMGAYEAQDVKFQMRGEMDGQGRVQELADARFSRGM
ncbi:MAG: hypothetical protein Q9219_006499 [cf. Caloplaca sp. 3 TL-2023]